MLTLCPFGNTAYMGREVVLVDPWGEQEGIFCWLLMHFLWFLGSRLFVLVQLLEGGENGRNKKSRAI